MGRRVRVDDSYRIALMLDELADDELLADAEKSQVVAALVLADPKGFAEEFGEDTPEALKSILRDAFDADASSPASSPKVDLQQDGARIKATMRMAYGMNAEELMNTPWRDVADFVAMSPHETPMGQALYYRTAKRPKPTRYNREEVEAFDRARRFYRLRPKRHGSADAMQEAQTDLFRAYERMGHGRR